MNKRNKKIILLSVTLCLAVALIAYAASRSSKKVENSFAPANANIGIVENEVLLSSDTASIKFEEEDNTYTAEKKIEIKNTGGSNAVPVFVRVCIFPKFDTEQTDGTNAQVGILADDFPSKIENNSFTMGDVTFNLVEDWNSNWYYENGYFYYIQKNDDGDTGVLDVGSTTSTLLNSVTINKEIYDEDYTQKGAKLKVVVLADSVQTVGDTASGVDGGAVSRWGVSKLESADEKRPTDSESAEALEASVQAFGLTGESRAAVTSGSALTQGQMKRVQSMIASVTVSTVYEPMDYYESENDEESEVTEEDISEETEESNEEATPTENEN